MFTAIMFTVTPAEAGRTIQGVTNVGSCESCNFSTIQSALGYLDGIGNSG